MKEEWRKAGYLETAPPTKKKKEVAIRPADKVYKRSTSVRSEADPTQPQLAVVPKLTPRVTLCHIHARPRSQSLRFADAQTGRVIMWEDAGGDAGRVKVLGHRTDALALDADGLDGAVLL